MITKAYIRYFLEANKMPVDELANRAGVARWSLRRFLKDEKTSMTLRTAEKLSSAITQYEGMEANKT